MKNIDKGLDPYEALANAIIVQAAQDVRVAYKAIKRNPKNYTAQRTIDEVEKFFNSAWFEALTDVEGSYLIRKLREEAGLE